MNVGYYEQGIAQSSRRVGPVYYIDVDLIGPDPSRDGQDITVPGRIFLAADTLPVRSQILAPDDGQSFERGQTISFRGRGVNGTPPYAFRWTSDLHGVLSTAAELQHRRPAARLPRGRHGVADHHRAAGHRRQRLHVDRSDRDHHHRRGRRGRRAAGLRAGAQQPEPVQPAHHHRLRRARPRATRTCGSWTARSSGPARWSTRRSRSVIMPAPGTAPTPPVVPWPPASTCTVSTCAARTARSSPTRKRMVLVR